jgi:hypothetical protein
MSKLKPVYIYAIGLIPLGVAQPILKDLVSNPVRFTISIVFLIILHLVAIKFGKKEKPEI